MVNILRCYYILLKDKSHYTKYCEVHRDIYKQGQTLIQATHANLRLSERFWEFKVEPINNSSKSGYICNFTKSTFLNYFYLRRNLVHQNMILLRYYETEVHRDIYTYTREFSLVCMHTVCALKLSRTGTRRIGQNGDAVQGCFGREPVCL